MNNKIFIIFSLLIINYSLLITQPGWIQNYDPFAAPLFETGYQVGNILLTDEGDFVVNGTCIKSDEFDWYQFGYLMKTDSEGNIIWAEIDSVSADPWLSGGDSKAFAVLPDGGFVSIGRIWPDPSYLPFRDSEGNNTLEELYYDQLNYRSMVVDHDNNSLIITGSHINVGAMLQKTDLDGNQLWLQTYDEFNLCISVSRTIDGGYALGIYGNDFGIAKVDSEGNIQWYHLYDYNSQNDYLNSIIQTSDGGYLLCGRTYLPDGTDNGGFLIKTDAIGDTLWTRKYDTDYCSRVYTSVETESGFTLIGNSYGGILIIFKLNYNGNELMYEEIPVGGVSSAEIVMQQTSDNGFLIYLTSFDYFSLIKTDENGIVSISENEVLPNNREYLSCYPNPFNPSTTIKFELPTYARDSILEIFNIKGQLIDSFILNENQNSLRWNAVDQCSGIYLYHIKADNQIFATRKMVLLK